MKFCLNNLEETGCLASWLAQHGPRPAVYLLRGELGAGKTQFAKGFAKGLGISDEITSPSFALLNRYPVPNEAYELYHMDLYRLEDPYVEWDALGFEELIEGEGLCLIEWPERIEAVWPASAYNLTLLKDPKDPDRRVLEWDERLPQPPLKEEACCN